MQYCKQSRTTKYTNVEIEISTSILRRKCSPTQATVLNQGEVGKGGGASSFAMGVTWGQDREGLWLTTLDYFSVVEIEAGLWLTGH